MRRYLSDLRLGFRQLCSRDFWRDFRDYWSSEAIGRRIDNWVEMMEEASGRRKP